MYLFVFLLLKRERPYMSVNLKIFSNNPKNSRVFVEVCLLTCMLLMFHVCFQRHSDLMFLWMFSYYRKCPIHANGTKSRCYFSVQCCCIMGRPRLHWSIHPSRTELYCEIQNQLPLKQVSENRTNYPSNKQMKIETTTPQTSKSK